MSFEDPVVTNNGELIKETIHSPDYIANTQGWSINRDGSAEFNNVTIRFDLATGSIVVGPAGMPQVIIDSNAANGFISFPTNAPSEVTPAFIYGQGDPNNLSDDLSLILQSGTVTAGQYAFLQLESEPQDLSASQSLRLGLDGLGGGHVIIMDDNILDLNSPLITTDNEILVKAGLSGGNNPNRVVRGKVRTSANNVTLAGTDTLITNADITSTQLENGVAYKVEYQIRTRSSSGTSAVGTQIIAWKLWDGAVGGTQLGSIDQISTNTVGTNQGLMSFAFVFEFTGTTGLRTLNLSGALIAGTDTVQAVVTTDFFALVNRIGNPANVVNL